MLAVDGARVSVAALLGRDRVARLTAVRNVGDDGLRTGLDATATEFRACGESSPAGEDAIDRASLSAAGLIVFVVGAPNTTVSNVGDN
jgi:hypothetical protein